MPGCPAASACLHFDAATGSRGCPAEQPPAACPRGNVSDYWPGGLHGWEYAGPGKSAGCWGATAAPAALSVEPAPAACLRTPLMHSVNVHLLVSSGWLARPPPRSCPCHKYDMQISNIWHGTLRLCQASRDQYPWAKNVGRNQCESCRVSSKSTSSLFELPLKQHI